MNRRNWIFRMTGLLAASALPFGAGGAASNFPLNKSRDEWRKLVSPEASGQSHQNANAIVVDSLK